MLENIIENAIDYAKHKRVVLLLKNAVSVITDGERTFINTTGCVGMAKAGSGDVLSGLITGMVARCEDDLLEIVSASAFIFGIAGEIAQKNLNEFSMTASDIVKSLPKAIDKII